MVSTFNSRARTAGISESVVSAQVGDLFDKSSPSPAEFSDAEWSNFDLATVGFGFHHFEDVVFSARQLKERLRPGGVLVINDFLEGGDMLADEDGKPLEESRGNHAVHGHGRGHAHGDKQGHSHDHDHGRGDHHGHSHNHNHAHGSHQSQQQAQNKEHKCNCSHKHEKPSQPEAKHTIDDTSPEFLQKMAASIIVPHFTLEGVRKFFTEAGFVDVDVKTMKEVAYMEFAGKKLWRTILFAKGRRPEEGQEGGKSEL